MKVLNKIFVGGAALVLLTGCNLFGPSKISAEKFQAKIDKLEEHQYSEVKITAEFDVVGTGDYADETEKGSETGTFTWNAELESWVKQEGEESLGANILCLYGMKVEDLADDSEVPEGLKQTITYYSNMKVVIEQKGTAKQEGDGFSMEITYNDKYVMQFDKY